MTARSANTTDLNTTTLMFLHDYIQALLPTLGSPNNPSKACDTLPEDSRQAAQTSHSQPIAKPIPELLWAVENQQALSELRPLLANHHQKASAVNGDEEDVVHEAALFTLQELTMQPIPQRHQLACFWLPNLSAETLQQHIPLLMRYRDLYAAHMLVALDEALDLRAYGFTPLDLLEQTQLPITSSLPPARSEPSLTLWQFNLYDYKKLPNWLNSDYWANPENWDKHRW
ncbi:DUF6231 family protein [Psychrobacter sp. H8-1]|uniref:DUF6231 family protein n=1 Tax=Psychrobacter sp. H8-1 TaxID=2774129 RepID=UPI00191AB467|nr:DUF6231 family protein [Psychrobacter sp. H8-1]